MCRTELFTYQYDPIRILESSSTYILPEDDDVLDDIDDLIDIEVDT